MADQPRYRQSVNLSGFLVKKGKVFKLKTRRFFRMNGTQLGCYKTKVDSTPSWEISIKECSVEEHPEQLHFVLNIPDAVKAKIARPAVLLWAESKAEYDKWVAAFKEASASCIEDFYEIGALVGKGAYGEVREAKDKTTGDLRAVKIIERTGDMAELEFIRREVEVMRKIQHPNVVRTYDIFDAQSKLYIVMDYVGGGDLFEVIAENENFSEQNAAQVMQEILKGVAYLHDKNIVHRDIKPENILCLSRTFPFKIKLTDFGFANFMETKDSQMQTMIGTPFYMAPEILRKEGHGPPVDLFACGVVCYAMLSGTLPFDSANDEEENVFKMITEGRVTFPDPDWKNVSSEAKDFVRLLLHPDPAKRPTAHDAIKHPWFSKVLSSTAGMKRLESDLSRLKKIVTKKSAHNLALGHEGSATSDALDLTPAGPTRGSALPKLAAERNDDDDDLRDIVPEAVPVTEAPENPNDA